MRAIILQAQRPENGPESGRAVSLSQRGPRLGAAPTAATSARSKWGSISRLPQGIVERRQERVSGGAEILVVHVVFEKQVAKSVGQEVEVRDQRAGSSGVIVHWGLHHHRSAGHSSAPRHPLGDARPKRESGSLNGGDGW